MLLAKAGAVQLGDKAPRCSRQSKLPVRRAAEELTRLNERLGRLASENLAFSRDNAQLRAVNSSLEGEAARLGERCVLAEQVPPPPRGGCHWQAVRVVPV